MSADLHELDFAKIIEQVADSVMITDLHGRIIYVNPAFEKLTGFSLAEVRGKRPSMQGSGFHSEDFYKRLWKTVLSGQCFRDIFINRKRSGELYYEEKSITPIRSSDGNITHMVSTAKDISEQVRNERQLSEMTERDALTGLRNRSRFFPICHRALAQRNENSPGWLLYVDLDAFNRINQAAGFDVGDKLLQTIGDRLARFTAKDDHIARMGGDEFAVLYFPEGPVYRAQEFLRELGTLISAPIAVGSNQYRVTGSIGVALWPRDGRHPDELVRSAQAAMRIAKDRGGNGFELSMPATRRRRADLALENDLHHALEQGEFRVFYQPQISLATGRVEAAEALLRWQHPVRGLLLPAQFLNILENTGLIMKVGLWVFREACRQQARWHEVRGPIKRTAINLSPLHFRQNTLAEDLAKIVRAEQVDPEMIEVEITESAVIEQARWAANILGRLKSLGLRLCIDDFATGYSSLSYLIQFPVNALKIPKPFIQGVPVNQQQREVTRAILSLARSLDLDTTAEGVCTEAQAEFLRTNGCTWAQGYGYSAAIPAESLETLHTGGIWPLVEPDEDKI